MVNTGGAERHPADTARILEWWVTGEGGQEIRWGVDGDWARCVVLATTVFAKNGVHIDPKAFCSNRHVDATGARPGHAPGEGALKHHG